MTDFEKLGVFYLGKAYDLAARKPKDELVLYDAKDLVTHAVCVGMTGSGKTGLCLTILEEAAIDGIPAIVIDPKGDLANLLLTFPELRPQDFAPWINEDDARRKGVTPEQYATEQAEFWKKGLADWGQDGARIARMREAADLAIYTPGSNAGLPVSILRSFAAPSEAERADTEAMRERTAATATSLLGLLEIDADPLKSREHILLTTILHTAWSQGEDVDLAKLIEYIQKPPVQRVGVMELETFYPAKDRFGLAMQLNNLLGTPGFAAWLEGDPLDISAMLHTKAGKPRISIFSIAHLSDSERMFFVSLLLNQTLSWVRQQSGTTSLRAIVYMDEIFGYFPPVANPPSKKPLLTLLKQARAFGVGVMLATQNPVDLDYKGLANAGTWFVGRLQTERDKARLLDGLEGAAEGFGQKFDRQRMEQTLAGLGNRVFLMNNVHETGPEIFQVRWSLSYLRGPLTRQQIKTLMDARKQAVAALPATQVTGAQSQSTAGAGDLAGAAPMLPPEVPQYFLPHRSEAPEKATLVYRPNLLGHVKILFDDTKVKVDHVEELSLLAALTPDMTTVPWDDAEEVDVGDSDLEREPAGAAQYAGLPASAAKAKSYDAWKKNLVDSLFRKRRLTLYRSAAAGLVSGVGESEQAFRVRLQQAGREARDAAIAKLRQKYASKLTTLQDRLRRAQQAVDREAAQANESKLNTAVSFGTSVLGALFGRKKLSVTNLGRAATAARGVSKSMKESADVGRANENVMALERQLADLESQIQAEAASIADRTDPVLEKLEEVTVKPKKTSITIHFLALTWAPYWRNAAGNETAAY